MATTLFRHGRRFLLDVFHGEEALADSINHLLVVLGIMHFGNLLVFTQMRQRAQRPGPAAAPPPPGWQPQPPR